MATKARQQYFADENSLKKDKREFSISDDIIQKIDSIEPWAQVNKIETVKVNWTALIPDSNKAVNVEAPDVIDNLYTVDSDNALSAKQWKLLYDYIQNIASRWRFLSNWNSATWLPMTNPSENPYPYKSWDYFNVSNVAWSWGTNYRPDGSSYIIWQASTVVETEDVSVSDFYFYDGTNWLLLSNSGRQIAIDTSLSTTSTNPVENRVITNALNWKQKTLIAWSNIQIAVDWKTISATDTTYSAWANISIDANNEISAVDTTYTAWANVQISNQNVISATDTKYTAWTWINIDANNVISNTQTSAEWWNISWTLSDQTDLQTALDAKANESDVLTKTNTTSYTPSANYHPATKKYVDDAISHAGWWDMMASTYDPNNIWSDAFNYNNFINTPTAWNWIDIDQNNEISIDTSVVATQTDLASKQDTLTAWIWISIDSNNEISNTLPWPTIAATAPTGTEWALWYDTTNDVLMAYNWTAWKEAWTQMKVLSYGHSTWQDFIDAYNENAIVYCRASSNSNPWSWVQWRMAFMAFVSINSTTLLPTEVEFQYYRSRSDHNTAANQLDQVFVYKLTSASWWTWTVTERNTWAKAVAWTWISLWWGSGNMTISADTTVLATQTDLNSKQDTISDLATIRSWAWLWATAIQPWDNISDLTNDSWFITSSYHDSTKQDVISDLATIRSWASAGATAVQSGDNVSELTNDAWYLTSHQTLKTVNWNSLLGSGNVSVWTLTAETVVSGDSWVTYTIKKSTTTPSWAGSNTITLVIE